MKMDGKPISVRIDGKEFEAVAGATVLDILNKTGLNTRKYAMYQRRILFKRVIRVLWKQTEIKRACSLRAEDGMTISLSAERVKAAQKKQWTACSKSLLYCTVCDNNNGNCKLHNTAEMMGIEDQKYPYTPKEDPSCAVDMSHPLPL
ncbi:2Fe-2S iron-sulfur cluster-binding protein [Bacillus licheniformis]|nr:2Fe-2S iron-sulfur cluster-binding protein [Bacillus licheniformis]